MSHFNVSLTAWSKSQDSVHKPYFLKRRERRAEADRTKVLLLTSPARLTARPNRLTSLCLIANGRLYRLLTEISTTQRRVAGTIMAQFNRTGAQVCRFAQMTISCVSAMQNLHPCGTMCINTLCKASRAVYCESARAARCGKTTCCHAVPLSSPGPSSHTHTHKILNKHDEEEEFIHDFCSNTETVTAADTEKASYLIFDLNMFYSVKHINRQ